MNKITDYAGLDDDVKIVKTAIELLGLDSIELIIVKNDKVLDKFKQGTFRINALLHPLQIKNTYELILSTKPDKPMPLILCHEMIHLNQFVNNKLSIDIPNKIFTWKGKVYDNNTEYENRPWEVEALNGESDLLKKVNKKFGKKTCLFDLFKKKK